MLREQMTKSDLEREREREQMADQIENLRQTVERQSADHRQALAVLTDQRDKIAEPPKRRPISKNEPRSNTLSRILRIL